MTIMGSTVPFSMRLDEHLKSELAAEAELCDRPASYVASRAIKDYLLRQKIEREILRERLKQADAGVFVSQERVSEWMNSWFTENELPAPEPDIFPNKS